MKYRDFYTALERNKRIQGYTNGILINIRNLDDHWCFITTIIKANNGDEIHYIHSTTEVTQTKAWCMVENNDFNWKVED